MISRINRQYHIGQFSSISATSELRIYFMFPKINYFLKAKYGTLDSVGT